MRYFITFSYNGTDFHGSQTQPNGNTVQAEMEAAFATILREPVALTFAGRTDAGVHAEKMVAHFDWPQAQSANPSSHPSANLGRLRSLPANLVGRLNSLLPASIAVQAIQRVTDDAHARFDATSRTYHYRITTRKDPFTVQFRTRVGSVLDFTAMNEASKALLGKQDFASFCRAHTDVKTTICDVREARWVKENRFLRNMVRAVVGTLFEVGKGKMTADEFAQVIAAKDRCKAGHSAPAEGLALIEITYPNNIIL